MAEILTPRQVVDRLKERTRGSSQAAVAKELNLSPAFICDVLKGRRDVTKELARKLGYRRIVQFERVR